MPTLIVIYIIIVISSSWNWLNLRVRKNGKAQRTPGFWLGEVHREGS